MIRKSIAIVLGGTSPHIALIENLKLRGYYTILLDYLENPPARPFADRHLRESTLDKEKVLEVAVTCNASLVISTCVDQANTTACYVAEKLNLPKPYSYETSLKVTDKESMKKIMLENGIPTAKFCCIKNLSDFDKHALNFPVVVKPSDCTGSKGVRKANNKEELKLFFLDALKLTRSKKVIVEEFTHGKEIQIDFFIQNRNSIIIMTRQKNHIRHNGSFTMQSSGSSIPVDISEKGLSKIRQIADQIPAAFNINNTSLFIQAMINKEDDIKILEFAPRVGGGLSYKLIELYTGFDFLNATVDSFLNIVPDIKIQKKGYLLESVILYAKEGVFNNITGLEYLFENKIIYDFDYFKTKGMQIGSDMSTRSRVGAFIVKAETKEELNSKIKKAINSLQVWDINGKPIMIKDIYKWQE